MMQKEKFGFEMYSQGIRRTFKLHSDQIAISCLMKNHSVWKVSFGVLLRYIEDFQMVKEQMGLKDGDRVLVLADTTVDAFITFLVLSANHLTAVMADAAIPDEELLPLIEHCQVSAIFTDMKNSEKMLKTQRAPIFLTYGLKSCGRLLMEATGNLNVGEPTLDSVAILFSSGTTARRKCVDLPYATILITHKKIKGKNVLHSRIPGRPMLEVFPMSHVSGLFSAFTLLYEGMSIATVENISSDTLVEAFKVFKPMAFGMVPKVNDMFIDKFEEELKKRHLFGIYSFLSKRAEASIRRTGSLAGSRRIMAPFRSILYNKNFSCLFSGGASGTPHTAEAIQNMGISYLDLFSSTECGVYIAATEPGDTDGVGSVGNIRNDPYTQTIIHAPDADGIGEIYVKTDQIMNGYFREADKTKESFDGEYFKTGDLGRIDEKGYLYVTGRIKESILMPNGSKVAPADLERLLAPVMLKGINYAIAGVPSPEDGADRIHLFIEKEGISDEQKRQMKESILQYQYREINQYRISGIHFIDEIPQTKIGKPKRYLLKEYVLSGAEGTDETENGANENATPEKSLPTTVSPEKIAVDEAEVEEKVFKIVRDVTKYEKELTGLENFKEDLGMDSLTIMEMCTEIESEFSVSVGAFITVIPNAREMIDYILDPIFENLASKSKNPTKKVNAFLYPMPRKWVHKMLFNYFKKWSRRKLDFRVEGIENVQRDRQYIFCPNHQTHFDGLFVWTALGDKCPKIDRFGCMSKAEHLDQKVTTLMMKTLGGIPVERSGNTIDSTQRSINFIKEGNSFLLHPEGTRTRTGALGAFKDGAARIALETGISIIPVAIVGGYEIWPYNRTLPETKDKTSGRKRTLKIIFCTEVQTLGRSVEDITQEIRDKIVGELDAYEKSMSGSVGD